MKPSHTLSEYDIAESKLALSKVFINIDEYTSDPLIYISQNKMLIESKITFDRSLGLKHVHYFPRYRLYLIITGDKHKDEWILADSLSQLEIYKDTVIKNKVVTFTNKCDGPLAKYTSIETLVLYSKVIVAEKEKMEMINKYLLKHMKRGEILIILLLFILIFFY